MELTRDEVNEIIKEMSDTLTLLEAEGYGGSGSYIMLWRRMMRLEETLNRHPY